VKEWVISSRFRPNATRIVVSGFDSFSTLDELAEKEIYVNPLTIAIRNCGS
jgi:hypothetical protein